MSSTAERATEQEQEALRSKSKELIDGFKEALNNNQAFKDALAETYLRRPDLENILIGFIYGANKYSFVSSRFGDYIRLMKYEAGDLLGEKDIEDLDVECSKEHPLINYRQRINGEWGGTSRRGFDAVGPAQKLLDGLKPVQE